MPLAWQMVAVQFGYLGMRLFEWRKGRGLLLTGLIGAIRHIRKNGLKGDEARKYFMLEASEPLLKASKCADFVVDRGHYFGTAYSEDAKNGDSKPLTAEEKSRRCRPRCAGSAWHGFATATSPGSSIPRSAARSRGPCGSAGSPTPTRGCSTSPTTTLIDTTDAADKL